jgi:hypothetical protein
VKTAKDGTISGVNKLHRQKKYQRPDFQVRLKAGVLKEKVLKELKASGKTAGKTSTFILDCSGWH